MARGWGRGTAPVVSCTHFSTGTSFTEEADHAGFLTSAGGRAEHVLDHLRLDGHSAGVPPRLRNAPFVLGTRCLSEPRLKIASVLPGVTHRLLTNASGSVNL